MTSAATNKIPEQPDETVGVAREQIEWPVVVPIHGADTVLADGVAGLELFGERRAARATGKTGRSATADIPPQTTEVVPRPGRIQISTLPEAAGDNIEQTIPIEVRDLHAGMGIADQILSAPRDDLARREFGLLPTAD